MRTSTSPSVVLISILLCALCCVSVCTEATSPHSHHHHIATVLPPRVNLPQHHHHHTSSHLAHADANIIKNELSTAYSITLPSSVPIIVNATSSNVQWFPAFSPIPGSGSVLHINSSTDTQTAVWSIEFIVNTTAVFDLSLGMITNTATKYTNQKLTPIDGSDHLAKWTWINDWTNCDYSGVMYSLQLGTEDYVFTQYLLQPFLMQCYNTSESAAADGQQFSSVIPTDADRATVLNFSTTQYSMYITSSAISPNNMETSLILTYPTYYGSVLYSLDMDTGATTLLPVYHEPGSSVSSYTTGNYVLLSQSTTPQSCSTYIPTMFQLSSYASIGLNQTSTSTADASSDVKIRINTYSYQCYVLADGGSFTDPCAGNGRVGPGTLAIIIVPSVVGLILLAVSVWYLTRRHYRRGGSGTDAYVEHP